LGVATATSINKMAITAPTTSSTLSILDTRSLTLNGSWGVGHARYNFAVDGGAISTITIADNCVLPQFAIIHGGTIIVNTAVTSGGAATMAVGATNPATTGAFKAAAVVTGYTANTMFNCVTTFAAPRRQTAAGAITVTIAVAAVTAGVFEIFVYYWLPAA
jgi:hypothetical protein